MTAKTTGCVTVFVVWLLLCIPGCRSTFSPSSRPTNIYALPSLKLERESISILLGNRLYECSVPTLNWDIGCNYFDGETRVTSIKLTARLNSDDSTQTALNGLGALSKLNSLSLTGDFTGTLPNSWGNLTSLASLNIEQTKISGSIPSSFTSLKSLDSLKLPKSISGRIPCGCKFNLDDASYALTSYSSDSSRFSLGSADVFTRTESFTSASIKKVKSTALGF